MSPTIRKYRVTANGVFKVNVITYNYEADLDEDGWYFAQAAMFAQIAGASNVVNIVMRGEGLHFTTVGPRQNEAEHLTIGPVINNGNIAAKDYFTAHLYLDSSDHTNYNLEWWRQGSTHANKPWAKAADNPNWPIIHTFDFTPPEADPIYTRLLQYKQQPAPALPGSETGTEVEDDI